MNIEAGAAVVVGADGSASSLSAIRAAASEAVGRERPLRIVHAYIWAALDVAGGPAADGPPGIGMRADAERILAEALLEAEKTAPGVRATTALVEGAPAPVLLRESRTAVLLVIGDRGLDGFRSLLLGSVALHTTTHAACPVLVVRGQVRTSGPVVVGVDGSAGSASAIGFAIDEAARRTTGLTAVLAWGAFDAVDQKDTLPLVYETGALKDEEHRVLSESLAGWAQRYPQVAIEQELVRERPAAALIERSQSAQLVVTGSRGRGGFTGLLLGSVSQTVLHHANCPVAIARTPSAD
ncbi:universal stress protein [Actinoplanes cyaneus]|uniref:Universal stress protein n=1 Tax=Actinoplanes cyaneus TaxID=52696 RepID=A0A919IW98_9ACTN|nr:universal stress protein [Actinoplanes cyaneus]MCW2144170.1 Nucleotide-binding universal stress protein, UspA family [Actinoplanes cyaneus]GID70933.1 universal stress protein [Actinoplanes cyaneus]